MDIQAYVGWSAQQLFACLRLDMRHWLQVFEPWSGESKINCEHFIFLFFGPYNKILRLDISMNKSFLMNLRNRQKHLIE